ncbi:glycosyltransferase [Eggerthellaceae bacterium zg-887]|uniref:CDP-glycerol glycerophosphotransferase family protein n=1 Tax=Xiamenia xianingshaonis TaxID=2682776 RepID=UPI00140A691D|nr:CDP-glycerol glycerophosphotransferase family protein [Xiamenia xianingshaonis]NHM15708.1 glycosyltransferase [Xiamenia xianingshaonis]
MLQRVKKKVLAVGKRWAKEFLLSWYYPRLYRKTAKQPVVPGKTIFLDNKESELPDSFQVLYDRLSYVPELQLEFMTLRETRVRFMQFFKNCVAFLREAATAEYLVLNDASNIVSCVQLRPETTAIQLWHGCGAFKKWGMSTADLIFGGSREQLLKHPYYRNLSLVTVSSSEVCWAYVEAMVLEDQPSTVRPIGVSRTDVFFDQKYLSRSRWHVYKAVPEVRGKKIIVYAPTFRGRVAKAQGPDELDIPAMKAALGDEYVLLVKHHPFVKKPPEIDPDCADFAFDVSHTLSINELICCADICISDYSSLVFEYSLFERPMIFFAFDKADYDDWRGFYYDYEALTPGPVFTTTKEVIDYIEHVDERFDRAEVVAFKEKFMSACDGHATDRIIETVFGKAVLEASRAGAWDNVADPLVSVIVPVCNAETHLRQCLDCIAGQTLEAIEIICVDDGSTDSSLDILYEYAARDPRMTVLTQDRRFAGVARNEGMRLARGKYLAFWDSDDYFALDALQKLYGKCESDGADVCVCGARQLFCDTGRIVHGKMYVVGRMVPDELPFNIDTTPDTILNFTTMTVWNKLFNREFVERRNLRFAASRSNNDVQFVVCALCTADAITVVPDDLVTYRRNQGVALTNSLGRTPLDPVKTWIATKDELMERGVFPAASFSNRAASSLTYMLRNIRDYEGFAAAAGYMREVGADGLGIRVDDLTSNWQKAFFRALYDEGVNEALAVMMHESYLRMLSHEAKVAELQDEVKRLKAAQKDAKAKA